MRISNTLRRDLRVVFSLVAIAVASSVAAQPTSSKGAKPAATPATSPATTGTKPAPPVTPAVPAGGAAPADPVAPPAIDVASIDPETMGTNLRLRRLEQQVQALKERAWRVKARTTQLKEAVLGGGIGAVATVVHTNKMGTSFRLTRLVYSLDGTPIFTRSESDNESLYKTKAFDVLTGPITRGSHTLNVMAVYRGHGYGVFQYLTKYTFTVRSSHTFIASEGKSTRIEAIGYEKGGVTTPLEKRPALDFKVSVGTGENQ